jgi:hypothetical protein
VMREATKALAIRRDPGKLPGQFEATAGQGDQPSPHGVIEWVTDRPLTDSGFRMLVTGAKNTAAGPLPGTQPGWLFYPQGAMLIRREAEIGRAHGLDSWNLRCSGVHPFLSGRYEVSGSDGGQWPKR